MKIVQLLINEFGSKEDLTIAIDGKTIRSTANMASYEKPLHIVTAQISELQMSFAQKTVEGKTNEIPAVQELLKTINIKGNTVVCDALHCQKKTAEIITSQKGDYLLSVKDNQPCLKEDIEGFVQDKSLQKGMDFITEVEKNRGRVEKRTAFVTTDIGWIENKDEWSNLTCIGAIKTEITKKNKKTEQWHYYIASKNLSAKQLLRTARKEWSVETMHWLLDVHFQEDFCRVEDKYIQQNLNMLRKLTINLIKRYKSKTNSKKALTAIMLNCLLDPKNIIKILQN